MSGQKPWKEKASLSSRSVLGPAKLLCIFWATFFCSCSQTWSIYKHYFARKTKREDRKAELQIGFWSFTIAHSRLEESGNEVFVCKRGDTYHSITAGSRQGSLAKPLYLLFLTPRQGCIKGFRSDIRYSEQPLIFCPYPDLIEKIFRSECKKGLFRM